MALIHKSEIDDFIKTSHGWNYIDEKLKKTFHFKTYIESIEFINELAKISERLNLLPCLDDGLIFQKFLPTHL